MEPLVDLGNLNIAAELSPPLQHQALREAYVLLHRLQLLSLQRLTPPPELPPRQFTTPLEQEDWVTLEAAVAHFDAPQQQYLLVPQQPTVVPYPEFVPVGFVQPPP